MAVKYTRLGNGTLTVGATPLDISSQVVGCILSSSASTGDAVTVLTGEQLTSGMSTETTLSGSIILDPNTGGIGEYSWQNHGSVVPFVFTPNTDDDVSASGTLTMTRLDIGADEYGALLNPDFEWTVNGDPVVTWKTTP